MEEGEPLPKVDVLVLPGSGSVDFDPLLSALQSPVRFLRVFPGMLPAPSYCRTRIAIIIEKRCWEAEQRLRSCCALG